MINEIKTHDLYISDELAKVLSEIERESLVASLLLRIRHKSEYLVDSPVNFISIGKDDRSKISYLTKERIESTNPEEYWKSPKRFITKPGSFVGKVFKNIPPKEIEIFSNLYQSVISQRKFKFEVVSGDRIKDLYNHKSYVDGNGSLGSSCMRYDNCSDFFDVYTRSEEVKMLAMFENDRLIGRAILWDLPPYKIMDRIYTSNDEELTIKFKKWANDNGYYHKSEQNWFNTLYFKNDDKKVELSLVAKVKKTKKYPYMDTFKFVDAKGYLYNYIPSDIEVEVLCATDGTKYNSGFLRMDDIDRTFRHSGDMVDIVYRGICTSHQNTVWSEVNDQYILRIDSIYNEEINDHIFNEERDSLNNKLAISERLEYMRNRAVEQRRTRRRGGSLIGVDLNVAIDGSFITFDRSNVLSTLNGIVSTDHNIISADLF